MSHAFCDPPNNFRGAPLTHICVLHPRPHLKCQMLSGLVTIWNQISMFHIIFPRFSGRILLFKQKLKHILLKIPLNATPNYLLIV